MTENQQESKNKIPTLNQRALSFSKLLMGALKTDRFARIRSGNQDADMLDLVDLLIDDLGMGLNYNEAELLNIPESGPFILIANHPMGGIDGLILLKLVAKRRKDIHIFANFMLSSVDTVNKYFTPLKALEQGQSFEHLAKQQIALGGGVVVFPAGMVSAYNLKAKTVRDRLWSPDVVKFIQIAQVSVVPVFIRGTNKLLLHLLDRINPRLVSQAIPKGFFGTKEREVLVRVGKVIRPKDLLEFNDHNELSRYLRAKVYLLGSGIEVKPFFRPVLFKKKWKSVVLPRDTEAIKAEIEELKGHGAQLHESKDFDVYWAHSEWIPNILYEIGRLRELTFREIGEGTGKNIDLDEYDLYYRHLFIWDRHEEKLVGAYRLGMGKEIHQRMGKRGFYLHSLFSMSLGFEDILLQSIELGRSFVAKEYQLKPLSLFLLWKGILYFILKHPEYRYLIGPVSISGEFSKISKFLIISFIKSKYYDNEMAALVSPRNEYIPEVDIDDPEMDALRQMTEEDIKKLDRVIEEIEMGNFRLPALLKKYLGQNAKIIAFNVDPKFNNALDGLLVMDLFNVPADTLHGLAKEFGDKELITKFTTRT